MCWSTGPRFSFKHLCLYIRESIVNAGMPNSFGIVKLSGQLVERLKQY